MRLLAGLALATACLMEVRRHRELKKEARQETLPLDAKVMPRLSASSASTSRSASSKCELLCQIGDVFFFFGNVHGVTPRVKNSDASPPSSSASTQHHHQLSLDVHN